MTSFIRKILFLAISSVCIIHFHLAAFATGLAPVYGISYDENRPMPQRQELGTFIKNQKYLDLYLLALQALQAAPKNQFLSYYQISGIHGKSDKWDSDDGGDFWIDDGFCQHANPLFPTWHRPYMALYEQTLYDRATGIVRKFPAGTVKNAYTAALQTWRMPYWDWAMDPTLPDIVATIQNVVVPTVKGGKLTSTTIPNPLFGYATNPKDPYTMVAGNATKGPFTLQTVRNPTVKTNTYTSQPSVTNTRLINAGPDLKEAVYNAFTVAKTYSAFSSMENDYHSIESVHGTIHVLVGGNNGHMSYPSYASYDPVFYLHHTNVDRLCAMWQVMYPDEWVSDNPDDFPNQDSALHPFRWSEDGYWTSRWVRDTTYFGYTYPEVYNAKREDMIATVNRMYGRSSSGTRPKRALPTNNGTRTEQRSGYIAGAPEYLIDSKTRNVYLVRIIISNLCKHGSFSVNMCLGNPSSNTTACDMEPTCFGSFHVFTRKNLRKTRKKLVKGTVCLTSTLNEKFIAGELKDMEPQTVKAYLKSNLKWTISGTQNEEYDPEGLNIIVVTAKVTSPKNEYDLPVWGKFTRVCKMV